MSDDAFDLHPIESLIQKDHLDLIMSGKAFLVLSNTHESFHSVVHGIYDNLVIASKIPPKQIILMSGSADILSKVRQISQIVGYDEINCIWMVEFEYAMQCQVLTEPSNVKSYSTLERKSYNRKFINLNRRWRTHRPPLVALFTAMGLLEQGYVSLGISDMYQSWDVAWPNVLDMMRSVPEAVDMLENKKELILNLPPLYIDTTDLMTNRAIMDRSLDYVYQNTYFSVISETNFQAKGWDAGNRFLTEKTFKAICKLHPFIIASVPRTVEALRSLGYRSFSPWIDESYDLEEDDGKRLYMIAKETERLCNLSDHQLEDFLVNVREICQHNLSILLNKKTFTYQLN
jgi:hypothetical protein